MPSGVKAQIDLASWPVPPIFKYLAKIGKIDGDELLHSFNMGVGMILVVPPAQVKFVEGDLKKRREKFFRIGRIERSDSGKARVAYSGAIALVMQSAILPQIVSFEASRAHFADVNDCANVFRS